MISFSYNKAENIIYAERRGEIGLEEVLTYIKCIDQNHQRLQNLYIIDDFRQSTSVFTRDEYPAMVEEISRRVNRYKQVKHAVIVDNPTETVLSILFEMISDSIENYTFKVFSTSEAAKHWLM